jgi:hypothetical protein
MFFFNPSKQAKQAPEHNHASTKAEICCDPPDSKNLNMHMMKSTATHETQKKAANWGVPNRCHQQHEPFTTKKSNPNFCRSQSAGPFST